MTTDAKPDDPLGAGVATMMLDAFERLIVSAMAAREKEPT